MNAERRQFLESLYIATYAAVVGNIVGYGKPVEEVVAWAKQVADLAIDGALTQAEIQDGLTID